jgi:hypothetical protein
VQLSLHTKNLKEAKKLRALRDVEWDAKFAACSSPVNGSARLHSPLAARFVKP